MRRWVTTFIASAVVSAVMTTASQAELIYSHSFDDLTDIVVTPGGYGTIAVSSEQAVDGSNSLKIDDDSSSGSPQAELTPIIGGGVNADETITIVFRYYLTYPDGGEVVDDHVNNRVYDQWNYQPVNTTRGYIVGGRLSYYDGAWKDSGAPFPPDGWFTVAYSADTSATGGNPESLKIYAAAGITVTTNDLVASYDCVGLGGPQGCGAITKMVFWPKWSGIGSEYYLDRFEIYSELDELPSPLIYSHSFDDLTDITDVGAAHNGSIAISSDQAVDGSNSLKLVDDTSSGGPDAVITPTIAGGVNVDPTIAVIARLYVTPAGGGEAVNDHGNLRLFEPVHTSPLSVSRGYPAASNMGYDYHSGFEHHWTDSGVAWPLSGWVTVAWAVDTVNDIADLYFAPGTDVTQADLVATDMPFVSDAITKIKAWPNYSGDGSDFYVDKLEIYASLDAVPPASAPSMGTVVVVR